MQISGLADWEIAYIKLKDLTMCVLCKKMRNSAPLGTVCMDPLQSIYNLPLQETQTYGSARAQTKEYSLEKTSIMVYTSYDKIRTMTMC